MIKMKWYDPAHLDGIMESLNYSKIKKGIYKQKIGEIEHFMYFEHEGYGGVSLRADFGVRNHQANSEAASIIRQYGGESAGYWYENLNFRYDCTITSDFSELLVPEGESIWEVDLLCDDVEAEMEGKIREIHDDHFVKKVLYIDRCEILYNELLSNNPLLCKRAWYGSALYLANVTALGVFIGLDIADVLGRFDRKTLPGGGSWFIADNYKFFDQLRHHKFEFAE